MIKHDGVDIPTIKYIDPVDGEVDILRVMQDGVQIWPSDTPPVIPNIPTGIQLSDYEIVENIDWDYTKMYIGEGENANLVTLYFTGKDADITSIPVITDFTLDPFNAPNNVEVFTDRVEITVTNPYSYGDTATIDYTPGVNPLKDVDGYLLTELNNQALDNVLPEPAYTYILDDYPGAVAAYSLRKLITGATDAIEVRRDNDDATTTVYLEDADSITLLSTVSAGGTLGDWIGSNNGFITTFYDQSGNGKNIQQTALSRQPQIISSGSIIVDGSTSAFSFDGVNDFVQLDATFFSDVISIFMVTSITKTSEVVLYNLGDNIDKAITVGANRTAGKITAQTSATISATRKGRDYVNGEKLLSSVILPLTPPVNHWVNTLEATENRDARTSASTFTLGGQNTAYPSEAKMQEFIVYHTDQTSNLNGIETNLNDYYNIWVVTSEVDAQLIQADADNLSDTVIEINGVRSSASDTAVANLISRNVTIITA